MFDLFLGVEVAELVAVEAAVVETAIAGDEFEVLLQKVLLVIFFFEGDCDVPVLLPPEDDVSLLVHRHSAEFPQAAAPQHAQHCLQLLVLGVLSLSLSLQKLTHDSFDSVLVAIDDQLAEESQS